MSLEVRVESLAERDLPPIDYRWDADTDILQASLRAKSVGEGLCGSVDIEGTDGSWLMIEVMAGRVAAIEVAVWPDVRTLATLTPPEPLGLARLCVDGSEGGAALEVLEVDASISAVADEAESTIHFRLGAKRPVRPVRVACDLLVEVDTKSRLAGLWFLNVPPCPSPLRTDP